MAPAPTGAGASETAELTHPGGRRSPAALATTVASAAELLRVAGDPAVLCASAGATLALALTVSGGVFGRRSLLVTTVAALLALAAAVRARRPRGLLRVGGHATAGAVTRLLLGATIGVSLLLHVVRSPAPENTPPRPLAFVLLAGAALVVLASFTPGAERAAKRRRVPIDTLRVLAWLGCAAGMGVAVFRSVPAPFIDVWTFQQGAVSALLHGHDPYTHLYPNIFGSLAFFSPAVADIHWIRAFPYPPLTILLGVPAYVLGGDTRYALLAVLLVGAWAVTRIVPGRTGALAAGAVLFHPRTFHLLDRGWTEPTVFAAVALALVALVSGRERGGERSFVVSLSNGERRWRWTVGLAGALLLASKQYALLFALPLVPLVRHGQRWRVAAVTAVALALVTVPFVLWDPGAFWRGVVAMQVLQPFRADSLSWPAALVRLAGLAPMPAWIAFVAAALAMAIAWPRRPALGVGVLCGSAAFLWFLLLGKQAFLNYYWLANALLFTVSALEVHAVRGLAVGGGG